MGSVIPLIGAAFSYRVRKFNLLIFNALFK